MAKKFTFMEQFCMRYGDDAMRLASNGIDDMAGYITKVILVNAYALSVSATNLPALKRKPAHWEEYVKSYEAVQSMTTDWVELVYKKLDHTPKEVIQCADSLSSTFDSAITQCDILIEDPGYERAIRKICLDIKFSISEITELNAMLQRLSATIEQFQGKMIPASENLKRLADLAEKDSKVDQKKVDELNRDINALRDEVNKCIGALVGLGIADAASVTLGILTMMVGPVAWLFFGACVAVSSTFIVINAQRIQSLKDSIEWKAREADALSLDVVMLNKTAEDFKKFADEAKEIEKALLQIQSEWNLISKELQEVHDALDTAHGDFTAEDWESARSDFVKAKSCDKGLREHAKKLELPTAKGNTAKIDIGMDQKQIRDALAKGTEMDYFRWVRSFSA